MRLLGRWSAQPRQLFDRRSPPVSPGVKTGAPGGTHRRPSGPCATAHRDSARYTGCCESRWLLHKQCGEAAGSFLRVGSEIGHRTRQAKCIRREVVTPGRSSGHLRGRAAAFPRWLYATATARSESELRSRMLSGVVRGRGPRRERSRMPASIPQGPARCPVGGSASGMAAAPPPVKTQYPTGLARTGCVERLVLGHAVSTLRHGEHEFASQLNGGRDRVGAGG
jgi:hypothetical protein